MRDIIVKTTRLQLRPRTMEEMKKRYETEQDPEMKQAYLEMVQNMESMPGMEEWGSDWIIELHDGTDVGGIGFKGAPDELGQIDVGYGIDEAYQRNGYATEAVAGILNWAFLQKDVKCVTAETLADNEISQKVLFANGFEATGRVGEEGPIFQIMKPFMIECEDIVLREFQNGDMCAIQQITLQDSIKEFLPDWIMPIERRKEFFIKYMQPENREFLESVPNIKDEILRLAILDRKTSEVIGWMLTCPKEELSTPNREIAYGISDRFARRGYTTQAALGLIDYLFKNTDISILNAIALTNNMASNRVINKCGFTKKGMIQIDGKEYNSYQLKKNK